MLPRFFDKKKKVEGKRTSQINATTIYSYVTKLKFDLYNTQRIPAGSQKSLQRTLRCCTDISHVLILLFSTEGNVSVPTMIPIM